MNFPIFTHSFTFPSLNLLLPSAELEFVQSRPQESDFRGKFAPSQNNILMGSFHREKLPLTGLPAIPHQQWSDIYFRIFAVSAYSMHVQVRHLCKETSDYSDISKIRSLIIQWFDLCSEDVRKKLLKCMIGLNYNGWGSKAHWNMESKRSNTLKTCITIHLYLGISSSF